MIKAGLVSKYTKEDKAGFCFGSPEAEELAAERKKQTQYLKRMVAMSLMIFISLAAVAVCLFSGVFSFEPPALKNISAGIFLVGMAAFAVLFYRKISGCRKRIAQLDNGEARFVHIEIIEKYPEEYRGSEQTVVSYFYPVKGRDKTTGYESVCYIDLRQYENAASGDTVFMCVYPEALI